ncbi:MAG: hypothetical protein WBW79_01465, partial [Desulfocapsaceae bacterium]
GVIVDLVTARCLACINLSTSEIDDWSLGQSGHHHGVRIVLSRPCRQDSVGTFADLQLSKTEHNGILGRVVFSDLFIITGGYLVGYQRFTGRGHCPAA